MKRNNLGINILKFLNNDANELNRLNKDNECNGSIERRGDFCKAITLRLLL